MRNKDIEYLVGDFETTVWSGNYIPEEATKFSRYYNDLIKELYHSNAPVVLSEEIDYETRFVK